MLLELLGLDAFYGGSHVLQGIELRVRSGQGVSLLGRNGAGKSTLLKSVMGAGPRVEASMSFDGQPLSGLPVHRRARMGISLVPEDRRLFPQLTVAENIRLARHATSETRKPLAIADLVRRFPMLDGLMVRRGYQLSGGQQQMVAVARGLISRPRLLLLDEPAEGLAPLIVRQLAKDLAAAQAAEGFALLLTEQNVDFARTCSSYVYVMDVGRIVFHGDWQAFDATPHAARSLAV
jgi:branched-chain amino acid transport system ATP-binding protein